LRKVKNIKGKLTLGIDSKINDFLVKTQQYFTQTQPEVKKYILLIISASINNLK
jgi:hypothetical protein